MNTYGVRHVHIEDDNMSLDRRRFTEILRGIIERNLAITWDTPNGIHVHTLDRDLLELMRDSGCTYAVVGVESGVQEVLDKVIRKESVRIPEVIKIFEMAEQVGVDLHAFYIIGLPRESLDQIRRTLSFAENGLREWDVIPHLSLARADPGTALYVEATEGGTLAPDRHPSNAASVRADMYVRNLISTSEFTPEVLEGLNEHFHEKAIRHLLWDRLRLLLGRPLDLVYVLSLLASDLVRERISARDSLTKTYWTYLLYRHSINRLGFQARILSQLPLVSRRPER